MAVNEPIVPRLAIEAADENMRAITRIASPPLTPTLRVAQRVLTLKRLVSFIQSRMQKIESRIWRIV